MRENREKTCSEMEVIGEIGTRLEAVVGGARERAGSSGGFEEDRGA